MADARVSRGTQTAVGGILMLICLYLVWKLGAYCVDQVFAAIPRF